MKKPERDYSHRSLFDKLGVLAEAQVAIAGSHDAAFTMALDATLEKAASRALRGRYDLIFLKLDGLRDLSKIPKAAAHLKAAGALWIFHPKGRGAVPSDGEVRAAGLAAGLVDNKISAYTNTHTATRFVIPLDRR